MPCCVAQFGVPAIVEGGPQVGLPCTLASLHPWGVAPASWVWCARCFAPPMLASRGTLNGSRAIFAWLVVSVGFGYVVVAARPCMSVVGNLSLRSHACALSGRLAVEA